MILSLLMISWVSVHEMQCRLMLCCVIGKVEFDLHNMPKLAKSKRRCRLRQLDEEGRYKQRFNLFEQKHARGWIPVYQEGPRIENREYHNNRTCTVSGYIAQ